MVLFKIRPTYYGSRKVNFPPNTKKGAQVNACTPFMTSRRLQLPVAAAILSERQPKLSAQKGQVDGVGRQ